MSEPAKKLVIDLPKDDNKPVFLFVGEWSGHDVKAVRNLLWREYLRFIRGTRLEAKSNQTEVTV